MCLQAKLAQPARKLSMSKLFSPVKLGPYELSHRVVMAPLTRMRSDPGDIPGDLMVEYYAQRASEGGLIISEATPVSIRGYGYAGAPGIYSDRQIAGWRRVTDAVHAKGGRNHAAAVACRTPIPPLMPAVTAAMSIPICLGDPAGLAHLKAVARSAVRRRAVRRVAKSAPPRSTSTSCAS